MLMSVFIDFDEVRGYEIVGTSSVTAVISNLVKLEDDQRFELDQDVEVFVSEFDDVLILREQYTTASLEYQIQETQHSPYLNDDLRARAIESTRRLLESVVRNGGTLEFHKLVINDTVYDATLR